MGLDNRTAEEIDEFVAYHLDQLLAGGEALEHFLADSFHADAVEEFLDRLEVYIGVEKCKPYFA